MTELQPALTRVAESRTRSLRGMVASLATGLVIISVAFVENAALFVLVPALFLCFAGPLLYSWFRGQLDFFEPIHIFGFIYFVFFGMGSIWTINDPQTVAFDRYVVPYVPKSALYCLLGYLALIAGYYVPFRGGNETTARAQRLRGPWFLMMTGGIGLAGFVAVGIQERAVSTGGSLSTVISTMTQLAPVFLFAWALAWMYFFSADVTTRQRAFLLAALLPAAGLTALATFSDKSLITTLIGVPLVARWYQRRKMPWTFLLVLFLVLVFAIFPFYNTYRWSDPTMAQGDRIKLTYQTVQSWNTDRYLFHSLRGFYRRMALINSVAVVVRDVPRWEPHAYGDTMFMPALTYFIPRMIWPDKPVNTFGQDFGRKFHVTNMLTRTTHIAVTIPGELYWNFGVAGILIGMGLFGAGLRLLYRRYGATLGRDPVLQAIYVLLLIQIAHFGASLAGDLVALVRTLMVLEAMRIFGRAIGVIETVPDEPGPATS